MGRTLSLWFAGIEARGCIEGRHCPDAHAGRQPLEHGSVGSGLLEYRIDYGPGYRICFGRDGDRLIVLLAGGTKRQRSDIATALSRWVDYKQERAVEMPLTRDFKGNNQKPAQPLITAFGRHY